MRLRVAIRLDGADGHAIVEATHTELVITDPAEEDVFVTGARHLMAAVDATTASATEQMAAWLPQSAPAD